MPSALEDGHKPLHRGRHARNSLGAAPCGERPPAMLFGQLYCG